MPITRSRSTPQLADEAGMSVPSFHSHFKAITVSPMQYLKSTRLHQARLLMVRETLTAEAAGYAVGYAARRSSAANSSACSA